jgi:hypothetical protein
MEDTTIITPPAGRTAGKPVRRITTAKPSPPPTGEPVETEAEELMHEIMRTQGLDLRESGRTRQLVRDFVAAISKGGK